MKVRHIASIVLFAVLSSCGVFSEGPQREVKISTSTYVKNSTTAFSTPADLRLGFLRGLDDKLSYCAEPLPDAALGSEKSASGSLAASAAASQSAAATATLAQTN